MKAEISRQKAESKSGVADQPSAEHKKRAHTVCPSVVILQLQEAFRPI